MSIDSISKPSKLRYFGENVDKSEHQVSSGGLPINPASNQHLLLLLIPQPDLRPWPQIHRFNPPIAKIPLLALHPAHIHIPNKKQFEFAFAFVTCDL